MLKLSSSINIYKKLTVIIIIAMMILAVATFLFSVYFKQRLIDEITVLQYKPNSMVENLVKRSGMNKDARFYFMASKPKLFSGKTAAEFNKTCVITESTVAILGCYRKANIYIYYVEDNQLDGINEVTAAHEILHAIYDRMNDGEKNKINKMLEIEYEKIKDNKNYTDIFDYYSKAEPGNRDNELFSIIATTVSSIDINLEEYYGKYFSNRQKVVEYNTKYSRALDTIRNRTDELQNDIYNLEEYIVNESKKYEVNLKITQDRINKYNELLGGGTNKSRAQLDEEKNNISNDLEYLKIERDAIKAAKETYDNKIDQYNSAVSAYSMLASKINSTLSDIPSFNE